MFTIVHKKRVFTIGALVRRNFKCIMSICKHSMKNGNYFCGQDIIAGFEILVFYFSLERKATSTFFFDNSTSTYI